MRISSHVVLANLVIINVPRKETAGRFCPRERLGCVASALNFATVRSCARQAVDIYISATDRRNPDSILDCPHQCRTH